MVATLKATTIDRVKEQGLGSIDINDEQYDAILQGLIDETSIQFEVFLGHRLLKAARTEVHDVERFRHSFFLREYPLASVATVKFRTSIATDWSTVAALPATSYTFDSATGRLYVDRDVIDAKDGLQVVYTGGFSTTTTLLTQEYPEIASAADRQVAYAFKRRNNPAASSTSVGASSVGYPVAFGEPGQGALSLLKSVRDTLGAYKRRVL